MVFVCGYVLYVDDIVVVVCYFVSVFGVMGVMLIVDGGEYLVLLVVGLNE